MAYRGVGVDLPDDLRGGGGHWLNLNQVVLVVYKDEDGEGPAFGSFEERGLVNR